MSSTNSASQSKLLPKSLLRKVSRLFPGRHSRPENQLDSDLSHGAVEDFIKEYPEYLLTSALDTLRHNDFGRLRSSGEVYVDYMGGSLYPESLIREHTKLLSQRVLGNTHSMSASSMLSLKYASEAREAVLSHFHASSSEYTVVFTTNATAALKLIGEAYPFTHEGGLIIGVDSHNSVHGLREFAKAQGALTIYIPASSTGGFAVDVAENLLASHRPPNIQAASRWLFAMTGQSNISNSKPPLSVCKFAANLGYDILLDAAALAATSVIDLSDSVIDAMAVSFYKMFGYPTGVGALIVKKSFLEKLRRPWFAGGNVDIVQVPGRLFTRAQQLHEQFEDGTINYLNLNAVTQGLHLLSEHLSSLPLRLSCLLLHLSSSISKLCHDTTGRPVVQILSKIPTRRLGSKGQQCETGFLLSCLFLDASGKYLPNAFIEHAATNHKISLRTGCMCNPGGSAALLGIEEDMKQLYEGATFYDFKTKLGREIGVVRISLGLASNFADIQRVIEFVSLIAKEKDREVLWRQWSLTRLQTGPTTW
ncbi:pyridoxal phosphate-dependent transferase [Crepidotus variabilis]|uniref:Pyridoxal phosphate-dependent transferase n=1 Tax=Crepidotus variabilis TaxID=179855 RepID=A0A9P6EQG9_9AGAR|nr:pyridoxal phosphate-dependent transferase [Crepidotus variabilis]